VRNLTSVFCSSSFCCSIWVASSSTVCIVIVWVSWEGYEGRATTTDSSGRGGEQGLFARAGRLRDAGWRQKAGWERPCGVGG
jgi:hypothetical protein